MQAARPPVSQMIAAATAAVMALTTLSPTTTAARTSGSDDDRPADLISPQSGLRPRLSLFCGSGVQVSRCSAAHKAACVRLVTSMAAKMFVRCDFTVRSIPSLRAICLLASRQRSIATPQLREPSGRDDSVRRCASSVTATPSGRAAHHDAACSIPLATRPGIGVLEQIPRNRPEAPRRCVSCPRTMSAPRRGC